MISDDMSDDKIKSDLGKSLAIMNVNGFLTPEKVDFNWEDRTARKNSYYFVEAARNSALALKEYRPKNKKFAELAEKLTTALETLDKSFALDKSAKNTKLAAEQKQIACELNELGAVLAACLVRSRALGQEIEKQDEKPARRR